MSGSTGKNCCCNYGAAVSGEWPEFQCRDCELHGTDFMHPDDQSRCKRHKRAAAAAPAEEGEGDE